MVNEGKCNMDVYVIFSFMYDILSRDGGGKFCYQLSEYISKYPRSWAHAGQNPGASLPVWR